MLKTNLHQNALLCQYLWKISNPHSVQGQTGGCLAVFKQVVCWKPVGQLWRETPARPLVQFLECLDAPRVDALWKEPTWWFCATGHIAQEALLPHQGSLSTFLLLLSYTKLQTTNPTGSYAPGPHYLNFPQEMQNTSREQLCISCLGQPCLSSETEFLLA